MLAGSVGPGAQIHPVPARVLLTAGLTPSPQPCVKLGSGESADRIVPSGSSSQMPFPRSSLGPRVSLAEASLPSSVACGTLRLHAAHVGTALSACLTLTSVYSVFPVYRELL